MCTGRVGSHLMLAWWESAGCPLSCDREDNPVLRIVKAVIGVAAWPVADLVARASSRCWDEGAGLPARAGEQQVNMAFARVETVQMWPTSDVKHE